MKIKIFKGIATGTVAAPPSKSIAHRALICGALSEKSIIGNVSDSDDMKATLGCLKVLGADVVKNGNEIKIGALDIKKAPKNALLDCIESGSTLRFMLPLCALTGEKITLRGSSRLLSRPLSVYEEIFKQDNVLFENNGEEITVCGKLKGGEYRLRGDVSSQFVSGLLFALPLCERDSRIILTGKVESRPYIDLTIDALKNFGISIEVNKNVLEIKGEQVYSSKNFEIEGDCSNAAFLDAFNYLGGNVTVTGLNDKTLQGDRVYKQFFEAMDSERNEVFDLSDCPDLAPILFSLSAAKRDTKFIGTKRLKIKESDRAEAMKQELKKFGIDLQTAENSVYVSGGELSSPTEPLYGHNDHRIVMSLAVLCTLTGGIIDGAEAVAKSYPDFFDDLKQLSIGYEIV